MDPSVPKKRPVGRPRQFLADADRQAAFRDRQADSLALGGAARALIAKPTLPFVELMMARLLAQAPDRDAMLAALLANLRKG